MADDPEPPRKRYELKPREFERANPPAAAAPSPTAPRPASAVTPGINPAERIDVRELYRQAAVPGPVLAREPKLRPATEVTAILQQNVAQETAAGLNELEYKPRPKSRRSRDYAVLMLATNGGLGAAMLYGARTGNVMMFVCSLSGMAIASAAITWVMWFIVDRY